LKHTLLMLIAAALFTSAATAKDIERHYCTQFGPFFLRFDDEKVAGVFNIFANNDMGSIIARLEGKTAAGGWIEVDSKGDIKFEFSEDWSSFDAAYSVGPNNGNWRTGWNGKLRPDATTGRFERNGVTYLCSRD
jgi:hypothetical protein